MFSPASTSQEGHRCSIKNKILSVLLGIALVISFMPLSASLLYADEPKALSKESNEKQTNETLLNQNSEHTDDSGLLRTQEKNNDSDNADNLAQSVSIVFTNDVHCKIDFDDNDRDSLGYAGVAAYRAATESTYGEKYVTLIDAGDAVQGDVAGTISKGKTITDLMNFVGYDYAIPGNHEYDFGMDQFGWFVDNFEGKYLSCNFTDADGNLLLAPYALETYENIDDGDPADNDDSLTIAYIGITTPETLTSSNPIVFQDGSGNYLYDFCNDETGQALYSAVQNAVDNATNEGADYIIAVGHLGETGVSDKWTSDAVIKNTKGIDAFIDGHSHETYNKTALNKNNESVPLIQTGTKLTNIGELIITPSTEEGNDISTKLSSYKEFTDIDETTANKVAEVNAQLVEIAGETVGYSEADLISEDAETYTYVRWQETNLADFITDAYRSTLETDVAFINGGGVRASLDKGDITLLDLISVQPFSNSVSKVEVSGQTLLDALEMGVSEYPEASGGFLQVSGLTYSFDSSTKSPVMLDDYENFAGIQGERRVHNVKVNGEPLDPDKTYTVASINYLLFDGGSGMTMFNDNTVTVLAKDVTVDNQAIVDYLETLPNHTITEEKYGNPEGKGRITEEAKEPEINPQPDATTDQTTIKESLNEPKEQSEETKPSKLAKTNDSSGVPLATLILLATLSALSLALSANRDRQKTK